MPKTNISKTNKGCTYFVYVTVVSRNHWFVKVAKVLRVAGESERKRIRRVAKKLIKID